MTISNDSALKYYFTKEFTGTGVVGSSSGSDVILSKQIRVVVENVGGGNTVVVSGKLKGQASFVTLATITGATTGTTVDTSLVDLILFNCTVYSASGGTPKLLASGFFKSPDVAATWGLIGGTLSNQTDLQTALNGKQNGPLTGEVTTSGAAATVTQGLIDNRPTATPELIDTVLFADSSASNALKKCSLTSFIDLVPVSAPLAKSGSTIILEPPVVSSIGASDIDWSLLGFTGGIYTHDLTANKTFTFSNLSAGQTILVRLTNDASNYTVTWPTVKWAGGAAPVMTIGAKSDIYTFVYDGTDVFGSFVQDLY